MVTSSPSGAAEPSEDLKKPEITAASIAQAYFARDLASHFKQHVRSKTVVMVHDSCYGHRYSRPRTSKSALSTIVERPERIHASILGLSTAYVRIGGRHAEGRHAPHREADVDANGSPPFMIKKSTRALPLNSSVVTQVHGKKWMEELQIMCDSAEGKLSLNGRELVRPIGYGRDENGNPLPHLHEGDLYLCSESLNALEGCLGGVCDGIDEVFGPGDARRAFVCIRPPGHHCSSNFPSGFCWLNNVHIGISHAASNHGLTHAAIIDFDLHHGDGSQAVAWDHNRTALNLPKNSPAYRKTSIGYFSLHDINSYPCEMGDEEKVRNASLCMENAHGQYIWNVHLEPWKDHVEFWKLYETKYSVLLEKTRKFLRHYTARITSSPSESRAKAAIFLSAGFDASEWEGAGMQRHKVNVPTSFYARFTADIVKLAEEDGLGVDGRVISVLEGGYSDRALTSGVLSHVCGLASDEDTSILRAADSLDGLSAEMAKKMGTLPLNGSVHSHAHPPKFQSQSIDTEWWGPSNLAALEALVNPTPIDVPSRKSKEKVSGNYSSPTQASVAKMSNHARGRRTTSGQMESRLVLDPEPPLPTPEVDWATASYELSRLLIPSNRQTHSCRHDELNAEASRVRRERQSAIGLPAETEQRMQLRHRKTKAPPVEDPIRALPHGNGNRRKTLAMSGELASIPGTLDENGGVGATTDGRPRRRSSTASSMTFRFNNIDLDEADRGRANDLNVDQPDGPNEDGHSGVSAVLAGKAAQAIAVKKTRVASGPKSQSTKNKTSPKKTATDAPAVPRIPSALLHKAKSNELDDLAAGMKTMSIKLKVPSPEENAAREKKALEERQKKARAPRKPALPKPPKAPKITPAKPTTETTNLPSGPVEEILAVPIAPQPSPAASLADMESPCSEAPVQDPGPASAVLDTNDQLDLATTETSPPQQPHQSSIPTSVRKTGADLPTFTSNSPIPFAKPQQTTTTSDALQPLGSILSSDPPFKAEPSPLPMPDAPAINAHGPSDTTISPHAGQIDNGPIGTNATATATSDSSIWEVPETPRGAAAHSPPQDRV